VSADPAKNDELWIEFPHTNRIDTLFAPDLGIGAAGIDLLISCVEDMSYSVLSSTINNPNLDCFVNKDLVMKVTRVVIPIKKVITTGSAISLWVGPYVNPAVLNTPVGI
jgi:hypothetical protein